MPIHDWTRVDAGIFHAFHVAWLGQIQSALNNGVLPTGYYALAEQVARPFVPDVVTLQLRSSPATSGNTVTLAKPVTRWARKYAEHSPPQPPQRQLTIRHTSGDRVIAVIEIVSPSNKGSQDDFDAFVGKVVQLARAGIHQLVIDLFPPTARDPFGLPAAIGEAFGDSTPPEPLPMDEPLTLTAYIGGREPEALIEVTAVGRPVPMMPLYLRPEEFVLCPLESTYQAAYYGLPAVYKDILADDRSN